MKGGYSTICISIISWLLSSRCSIYWCKFSNFHDMNFHGYNFHSMGFSNHISKFLVFNGYKFFFWHFMITYENFQGDMLPRNLQPTSQTREWYHLHKLNSWLLNSQCQICWCKILKFHGSSFGGYIFMVEF
jgi:hypothetical protein